MKEISFYVSLSHHICYRNLRDRSQVYESQASAREWLFKGMKGSNGLLIF